VTDTSEESLDLPTATPEDKWSKKCVIGIGTATLLILPAYQKDSNA
jgi:hypothetical protein